MLVLMFYQEMVGIGQRFSNFFGDGVLLEQDILPEAPKWIKAVLNVSRLFGTIQVQKNNQTVNSG